MVDISVPVWLFVVLTALAALALLDRILAPGVRWFIRRRTTRLIEEVNTRLPIELPTFKLTRRQVLIDRLLFDPKVQEAVRAHARTTGEPPDVVMARVERYARIIDPLIVSGKLPPVALVGVWVASGSPKGGPATGPGDDLRTIEYHHGVEELPGTDSAFVVARYRAHKRFFTEEVRRWAEDSLSVSTERRYRAVQGNSSGAHYALTLGRERPDLYGLVIANSNGGASALVRPERGWENAPRHYLSAGVLEPSLACTLTALSDSLARYGVPRVVSIYPSGHDSLVWRESLPLALAWWLGAPGMRQSRAHPAIQALHAWSPAQQAVAADSPPASLRAGTSFTPGGLSVNPDVGCFSEE
jgi:hypothetical protein